MLKFIFAIFFFNCERNKRIQSSDGISDFCPHVFDSRVKGDKSLSIVVTAAKRACSVVFFKRDRARVVPQKLNADENEEGRKRGRGESGHIPVASGFVFRREQSTGRGMTRLKWGLFLSLSIPYIDLPVHICHFRPRATFIGTHWGGRPLLFAEGAEGFRKDRRTTRISRRIVVSRVTHAIISWNTGAAKRSRAFVRRRERPGGYEWECYKEVSDVYLCSTFQRIRLQKLKVRITNL